MAEAFLHWSQWGEDIDLPVATRRVVVEDSPRVRTKSWTSAVRLIDGHRVMLSAVGTPPRQGDTLLVHCAITPPLDTHNPGEMDYGTWLRRHGIRGTAYCGSHWKRVAEGHSLRPRLVELYSRYIGGSELGVVAAMTLGDRSLMQTETREDFSVVGASHVLALSGLHLSILVALYMWGIGRWLRRWRWAEVCGVLTGLLLMIGYVQLAGAPVSLVRAATMLGLALLCSLWERRGLTLNNLALSALLLMLWSPSVVLDVGFQLSFVAVAAIVVATQRWPYPRRWHHWFGIRMELEDRARERLARPLHMQAMMQAATPEDAQRLLLRDFMPKDLPLSERLRISLRLMMGRLTRLVWDMTIVSLAAQVATLPLVVYYFHTVPLSGLWLSFVLIPMAYVLIGLALLFFTLPPLRPWVAIALRSSLVLLTGLVSWAASLPYSHLRVEWESEPPLVICHRLGNPELRCRQGQWQGNVLHSPDGRVVRIDARLPRGVPQHPLRVEVLWLCRGASGHLSQWIRLYRPQVVVLDATLSDYMYDRFRSEADSLHLRYHDIKRQGAYLLSTLR
ncbi:MAG: ComEC family competence protein [Bacteroidaceae bacterium]|nr:ComEC family competence protein [Bacteroidaceae bacterium]